jgi:hypothetical protein
LGVGGRGCGCVWVRVRVRVRFHGWGRPGAWGNIGECVGVTCGLQRKGKRPANSALLLFEEGEEEEQDY